MELVSTQILLKMLATSLPEIGQNMEAFSNLTAHLKKASSAIGALIQIGEALKTEGFEKIEAPSVLETSTPGLLWAMPHFCGSQLL